MEKRKIKTIVQAMLSKLREQPPGKLFVLGLCLIAVLGVLLKASGSILGALVPVRYTPCPDLSVESVAVCDGRGYFTVRNTGKQVITDFSIACIAFDANGNLLELGYKGEKMQVNTYTSVNILPGEVYGLWDSHDSFSLENDAKYAVATVSSVTYKNGGDWSAKGLNKWVRAEDKKFTIKGYARSIEHLRSSAALAEQASAVVITSSKKYNDNRFSNSDDLEIKMKNTGSAVAKDIYFLVLQYDANGYAVGDSYGGYCVRNAESLRYADANLIPGGSGTAEWGLFFEPQCKGYKVLIYKIEFTDGTIWKNEYAMSWMLYNTDKR